MGTLQSGQARFSVRPTTSFTRQLKRTNINVPVLLVCNGQGFRGWMNDVSEHGAGIISAAALHIGDQIDVILSAANLQSPLKLHAVVKHSAGFHHGCEFRASNAGDQEALRQLLNNSRIAS